MSGIYEFQGTKLYGDGREVEPLELVCICSLPIECSDGTCVKCMRRMVHVGRPNSADGQPVVVSPSKEEEI